MQDVMLSPASPKQEAILNSSAKVTLAGGAAGSGKTYILCLIALRFMQDPNATGIIFRRTTKQINTPGGIWSEAVRMYKAIYGDKLKVKNRDNEILFPNGAVLKFSHLEHESNIYDHQGGQYSFVAFDEGTHFTRPMVTYMLSRMRNARVKYQPQMFITCNPDADHWLKSFVDFCLDDGGIPVEEIADRDRFFVFRDDQFIWADKREDLEAIYGAGDESGICSFRFYPARCVDNPPLLKAQPDYISNLKALGRVEEARLLWGSWTVRATAAGLWKRDWIEIVEQPNGRATKRVRAWDLACTLPSELNRDPDYTVGALMSVDREKYFYIEDILRFRERHQGVEKMIFDTAYRDGFDVEIRLPREPGASGLAYVKTIQQKLAHEGFSVRLSDTNTGKVNRFAPFASSSEAGFVRVVRAEWNDALFAELETFDGGRKGHDDMCDAISDCHKALRTSVVLPDFKLPDLSQINAFASPWK